MLYHCNVILVIRPLSLILAIIRMQISLSDWYFYAHFNFCCFYCFLPPKKKRTANSSPAPVFPGCDIKAKEFAHFAFFQSRYLIIFSPGCRSECSTNVRVLYIATFMPPTTYRPLFLYVFPLWKLSSSAIKLSDIYDCWFSRIALHCTTESPEGIFTSVQ